LLIIESDASQLAPCDLSAGKWGHETHFKLEVSYKLPSCVDRRVGMGRTDVAYVSQSRCDTEV